MSRTRITELYGKRYVWVSATRTGQWRLYRIWPGMDDRLKPWADPGHDVLGDFPTELP